MGTQAKIAKAVPRLARQLGDVPRGLALSWQAAPRWTAAAAGLLVVQGLLPLATVTLSRSLVNGLVARQVRAAVASAALIAGVALAAEILRSLSGWVRTHQSELVQDHILALVHEKSASVDLAFYDSPEFFDRLHRARAEAYYRPLALIDSAASFLQSAVTLVSMVALLFSFGPWMPLALILGTAPALWVVLRYAIAQHEMRLRTTERERRTWYYDWLLTSREPAAELRLFGLGDYFRDAFNGVRKGLREEKIALARANAFAELAAGTSALAVTGASLGWMLWRALQGMITLGDLTLFYQALQQGFGMVRSLLDNAGQLYYNSLFVNNLFEFLALEPKLVSYSEKKTPRLSSNIRFNKVTFGYPGTGHRVLAGFDLEIPAGSMVALVGPNGSGKSTLVKLLCRFYDPTEGSIEFDGIDLRSFPPEELRSRVTVLFQEPVRYNATVGESIALGDRAGTGRVERAAEAAGADELIRGLPLGYETLLGKAFLEGEELSAGQWQRIALARAFYRQADLLILDEPTSAMDPWAEADWLRRFRQLAEGRTAILITHRLTAARLADRIALLDGGRVAEYGTHEELVALGGRYAELAAK